MYEEIKQIVKNNGWDLIHIGANEVIDRSGFNNDLINEEPDRLIARRFYRNLDISIKFSIRRAPSIGCLCAYVKVVKLTEFDDYKFDIYKTFPAFDTDQMITWGSKKKIFFEIGIDGDHIWHKTPRGDLFSSDEQTTYLSIMDCIKWQKKTEKQLIQHIGSKSFDDIHNYT